MLSSKQNFILSFSFLYAVILTLARIVIANPLDGSVMQAALMVMSIFANAFTFCLVVSYLFIRLKLPGRYTINAILFFPVLAEIIFFHYERLYARLPSIDLLFYLGEMRHLSSSLNSEFPILRLGLEIILVNGLLVIGNTCCANKSRQAVFKKGLHVLAGLLVICSILFQVFPQLIPQQYFWSTRQPLVWMLQSHFIRETYDMEKLQLTENDFQQFLIAHGKGDRYIPDPVYPLCGPDTQVSPSAVAKNIVLLILEGVGMEEMNKVHKGIQLMPNLQNIAADSLVFSNFIVPGTKSIQTLPAIFSGLPSHPFKNYLWHGHALDFNGFPAKLSDQGYATAYFHGADLMFEYQQNYLEASGFTELHDYHHSKPFPTYGWGYDDGVMFNELKKWIETEGEKPFLVSLATLSSHHPYILPEDWEPVFYSKKQSDEEKIDWDKSEQSVDHFVDEWAEAYRFMDHHLGEFYHWFEENQEDTLLLITGDHAFNFLNGDDPTRDRFRVPLIIAGLSEAEQAHLKQYTDRYGGSHDLPATIMSLLGQQSHQCDLGVNLLASSEDWPEDRYVYAVSGDSLEYIHIWKNRRHAMYDRIRNTFTLIKEHGGKAEATIGPEEELELSAFIDNLFKVHYYLFNKNTYFNIDKRETENLQQVIDKEPVIYISHRGNLYGPGNHQQENSEEFLDKVVESHAEWVEIDVQMTADEIPVLLHDSYIIVDNEKMLLHKLTLEQLREYPGYENVLTLEQAITKYAPLLNIIVEIKPVKKIWNMLSMSKEVSRIIRERPGNNRIIVDSFDLQTVLLVKEQCECDVGYDGPYKVKVDEAGVKSLVNLGLDWVFVEYSVIDKVLIEAARKHGIKVMAYTVNDSAVIDTWSQQEMMPDGIITDYLSIIK